MQNFDRSAERSGGPLPKYPIESVDNALQLLLLLQTQPDIRTSDAARYLDVAPSTAHRLLAMLLYRGLVIQQADSKAYVPGPALVDLASAVLLRGDLRARIRPTLETLSRELGETVQLGVLEGVTVRFIEAVESQRPVRVTASVGASWLAHCTAAGKVLLAQLPLDELRSLYPDENLERITPRSLHTRAELEAELDLVRRDGLSYSRQEAEQDVETIGIALPATLADLPAALVVSVPTGRMTAVVATRIGYALKRTVLMLT